MKMVINRCVLMKKRWWSRAIMVNQTKSVRIIDIRTPTNATKTMKFMASLCVRSAWSSFWMTTSTKYSHRQQCIMVCFACILTVRLLTESWISVQEWDVLYCSKVKKWCIRPCQRWAGTITLSHSTWIRSLISLQRIIQYLKTGKFSSASPHTVIYSSFTH